MADDILMTQEGYDATAKEVDYLKNVKLPEIIKRIDFARQLGDLSENAEYHEAKDDQGLTFARMRELEAKLHMTKIVNRTEGTVIAIGSKIEVTDAAGGTRSMEIVDQTQADPGAGKISNESPLGSAFVGKKEGEKVSVELPSGLKTFVIKKVL